MLTAGKKSTPWVEVIQRHVKERAYQTPERGDIKRACRTLSEQLDA